MSKVSSQERDKKKRKLTKRHQEKREKLLVVARNRSASPEEIFEATLMLAKLPRNSSPSRVHNRCVLTGRSKGYYRKFGVSRIMLRELGSKGEIPGLRKASW